MAIFSRNRKKMIVHGDNQSCIPSLSTRQEAVPGRLLPGVAPTGASGDRAASDNGAHYPQAALKSARNYALRGGFRGGHGSAIHGLRRSHAASVASRWRDRIFPRPAAPRGDGTEFRLLPAGGGGAFLRNVGHARIRSHSLSKRA